MKRSTKKSTTAVSVGPNSNLFNLRFDNFTDSQYLINNVDLDICTGFIDNEKLLTLNFTCLENEIMEAYDFFAPYALSDASISAELSIYTSKGVLIKSIPMKVQILRFSKSLSWDNNSPLSYLIESRFKFNY